MGSQVLSRRETLNAVVDVSATSKAYVTGEVIGVPTEIKKAFQEFGGTGTLASLTALDLEGKAGAVDFYFFQNKPTSHGADGANFALTSSDLPYLCGRQGVLSTDYTKNSAGSIAEATKPGLGLSLCGLPKGLVPSQNTGSDSLWVVAVARGSITFSSNSSLKVRVAIQKD